MSGHFNPLLSSFVRTTSFLFAGDAFHRAGRTGFAVLVLGLVPCLSVSAVQRQSTHYSVTMEAMDSAGGLGSFPSATGSGYSHVGSLGGIVEDHLPNGSATPLAGAALQAGYLSQLNNPPVPGVFVLSHRPGLGAKATLASLLSIAADPDGDPFFLTVETSTAQGGIARQTGRFLAYQPAAGFSGSDVIHYRLTDDGGDSASGAMDVVILPQPDTVSANQLLLEFPPSGGAHLVFVGALNQSYQVQVTDSLVPPVHWSGLVTSPSSAQPGFYEAVDPTGGQGSQRFYRTISL